jgi:hypothetical protein
MKMKSLLLTAVATLGLTTATMAQTVPSYVPTNGIAGWWPFNGNANDESGNNNHGIVNGATLSTDRFGQTNKAYNFNGLTSYIEIPNASNLQLTNNYSISGWFNANVFFLSSTNDRRLISKVQPTGWYGGYEIFIGGNTNDIAHTGNVGGNNFVVGSSGYNINNWYMFTVTYEGTTQNLYMNGVLVNSQPNTGSLQTSTLPLLFGKIGGNSGYFDGELDDIGIWNRALTSAEITALYTGVPTDNNETSNTTTNVPDAISYQAVARNSQGAPLADTNVQVQFTLLADSLNGAAEYTETHTLTTNSLGLFTTAFGAGTPVSGTFGGINWSAGNKYLNVQIDTGSGLVDMGTQQLLSTPYSLYSAKAGSIKNPGLPVYADNAAAIAGGLVAGDMYRTSAGDLKIVY